MKQPLSRPDSWRFLLLAAMVAFPRLWSPWVGASEPNQEARAPMSNTIGMRMIPIPNGTFSMGNPNPRRDGWDEQPVRQVAISQPFHISETEVTIEQFQQFRPGFTGSMTKRPYLTGVSWHDAVSFCRWLSEKEGKTYRLPTEAEWEYAARAGTNTPFWSGDAPPPRGAANPWGMKHVHSGPKEWCHDWYGPYELGDQEDPMGVDQGLSRVIRGGGLDCNEPYYARSRNRASYAPAFAMMQGTDPRSQDKSQDLSADPTLEGLIGAWFGRANFTDPKAIDHMTTLHVDWNDYQQPDEARESKWSAIWEGVLVAPADGDIRFHVASDYGVRLVVDNIVVVDWEGAETEKSGGITLAKGRKYPIHIRYIHNMGENCFINMTWSWTGQRKTGISKANLLHSPALRRAKKRMIPELFPPGHHAIGFRVVEAPWPDSNPRPRRISFIRQCVVQKQPAIQQGPNLSQPWFRQRSIISIPPDTAPRAETRAAGLHPGLLPYIHAPALAVCPNGDLLAAYFSSEMGPGGENQPEVLILGTRLRFGAQQWDMPEPFIDFADVNDTSACLWLEGDKLFCFWGHTFYRCSYPFSWLTSLDSGATWSAVRFPQFVTDIGPLTPQPINSIVRALDGTLYVPSDGKGGTSVLWASKDDGRTWHDTGGRTFGRHTSFVQLTDGRILGMGGKKTNIDGYMPKSITRNGGKSYEVDRTPFCELGSGQRPTLIRLRSGRLFFAGDFQHRLGRQPKDIQQHGAYVALSDDEGESWHIKKLPGTLISQDGIPDMPTQETIGYAMARQAPNGIIHLVGSRTRPNQHWELNEAWILSDQAQPMEQDPPEVREVESYEQRYPSGGIKAAWSGGTAARGAYLLHGKQTWHYENGRKQWEVTFDAGWKTGRETLWDETGAKVWEWRHAPSSGGVWTQYWPNGRKKSESNWRNHQAHGPSKRWESSGQLISEHHFTDGQMRTH